MEQTMIIITTDEEMEQALATLTDPVIKSILTTHMQELAEYELPLQELGAFYICEPVDTDFPGWSPLIDRNDIHYGQAGYSPNWEFLDRLEGCWELLFILSDDGFGYVVIVKDDTAMTSPLLELCRQYAGT